MNRYRDQLGQTLEDLAGFGEKRTGTRAGEKAAEYIRRGMERAGLRDIHYEAFGFPRHDVLGATFEVEIEGTTEPMPFEVLEACGSGRAYGPVVWAGGATPEVLDNEPVAGRIALVEANRHYHRSTQYQNLAERGAAAMLYLSAAPFNLRQAGSVRRTWEAAGPIPALSIGAQDGQRLKEKLLGGAPVLAQLDVQTTVRAGIGHNVVGHLPGCDPHLGHIAIGAHYDTWFAGSCDNGGGVASLLALAQRCAEIRENRYTLTFVAYDGEELALYGGYHFQRRRLKPGEPPLLAAINLETPSACGTPLCGLAYSRHAVLEEALSAADLKGLFPLYLGMEAIPQMFGGTIPTDIQGIYRSGVPTLSTAVDAPFYHTCEDTPDKVDLEHLDRLVVRLGRAAELLLDQPPERYAELDTSLWRMETRLAPMLDGEPPRLELQVTDVHGIPQANAHIVADAMYDDFYPSFSHELRTDEHGMAVLELHRAALTAGAGRRFLHLSAGRDFPLVESALSLDRLKRR